ncbi:hypothetical protein OIDMADRAFT_120170 [Oidiodendron maius Zn]|uniref:ubiquitinyl hydrolase 1 n=1 Tax=Oidiodendron maius (strain Zn) TaxID=913774 RepID=A0A0C3DME9_OIDMZ|nr:hypothetical protein OIDMADRAFT_120170 [Oidiodendron maius Zn]
MVLNEALGAVEGSWQGAVAIRTFVTLALRTLSLSPFETVQTQCFLFLRRARAVSLHWTRQVRQFLDETEDLDTLTDLHIRVLEMALTCHGTFDVERNHASEMFSSAKDIATFVECSITIHDHCPVVTKNLPQAIKSLLERFARRSHLLEPSFRHHALRDQQGIDDTVHRIWAGYRPSGVWTVLPVPNERWLVTTTHIDRGYSRMTVHYNILDGSLLVNGLPFTRLPQNYQLHATYRRLFGEKVLTVVPSSMVGMEFETRSGSFGQQIHFSMVGSELIIRTRNEGQVYELIPLHFLESDFPKALVHDYAHWLQVDTGSVEWRPMTRLWEPSQSRWLMQVDNSRNFRLICDGKFLVDVRSQTAQEISRILSPLEHATHIHVLYDDTEGELNIHLPRYKLDFLLKRQGTLLESKQFRGMAVDKVQSIGTLTGLVNKLVLRRIDGASRIIVVPQGEVFFSPDGHHVRVMINTDAAIHVPHHSYTIDNHLGRLIDNGSLHSRLFRIYLHAITSHCLIDQLTGRTGTEEALDCLAGAATRSFVELEYAEVKLLKLLTQLTPRRQFYPENLHESQQVEWLELCSSSQHGGFQRLVRSIFDQAMSSHIFQERHVQMPVSETRGMQHLLDRASIRDSSFQVHGFGAESHTAEHDVVYASRDQATGSYRELQTCHTARLVDNWSQSLVVHPQLLLEIESWGEPIRASGKEDQLTIGFDVQWLDAPSKFLPGSFYAFHHKLSHISREQDKYKAMILLSTLAYSEYAKQELVQTLLAFATVPELRALQLPDYPIFQLSDGYAPLRQRLASVVKAYARPFDDCAESKLLKLPGETKRMAERRRQDEYHIAMEQHISGFVEELMLQSPFRGVSKPSVIERNSHIMVDEATEALQPWFESWHRNAHFQKYVGQIQTVLNRLPSKQHNTELFAFSPPTSSYVSSWTHIRFIDLAGNAAPHYAIDDQDEFHTWVVHSKEAAADHSHLKNLLGRVASRCSSRHDERYAADLLRSYEALRGGISAKLAAPDLLVPLLERHLKHAQRQENDLYKIICTHLETGEWHASKQSHMLPRLSKLSILSQLASDKIGGLPLGWRKLFIQYGLSVTVLQRAGRLLASAGNPAELLGELRNLGHQNWDPADRPEWLLVEIENNILIRQEQSQVSREMISPSSGSNSVLQLSMGLGKSSVIVPIAAATLADRTKLVRVVVLKPLAMQMYNLLRQKLGGLLNRRVFYMPITRSLKLDNSQALQIHNMLEECMRTGGILLMQPEHILSFELMGFEKLLSDNLELGATLIRTQEWLEANSRDIIDESDEILSVKYELIYTMGMQQATEFSPDRWNIIQGVLNILGKCAHQVLRSFPGGLEVISTQAGAFPRVRIIQTKAGDALLNAIARQVCENGIPGVPVWRLPRSTRNALFKYLVNPTWSMVATESLHEFVSGSKSVEKALLLLKGLFGKGILRFCLEQKRWRVQYGLHLSRTKLAVPYYAKDSPSPRAEFSHPDVTIVLTCLSYYYGGLSDEQILASFETLLQSDHAPEEYAHWVQDAAQLPPAFRQLTGVNLGNLRQCRREIFPPLRFAMRIINFYMSNIVFPAEMKEFPLKLSSSGWDIAKEKRHPTTGFSGTNDSRYHLPLSISQRDLPQQLSTNAGVLGRLLRPENVVVDMSQTSTTGAFGANALINIASTSDPPARVILDVGAQVLELQNEEMAWKWLSSVPDSEAQAVIFFDSRNDICILSRDGSKELLEVSPFLMQMDACLVYLDEAHTRGTDLKMPANYRAIVTIGPGLTKDRLVQACMRMRKLGEGQSIALCGSTEIQSKILDHSGKVGITIEVSDVLKWCIANTCTYSRKSIPLWATQGLRYQRRHVICSHPLIKADGEVSDHVVKYLPEKEAQSLQERYGNGASQLEGQLLSGNAQKGLLQGREQQVAEIRAKCEEFDISSSNMVNLYEEQERELSPENEREKQVDRPPAAIPRKHTIHFDVQSLATHGVLKRSSDAFHPAFDTLRKTTADIYYETAWPKDLLVTTDFAQTVHGISKQFHDSYLRPVNWVVSCEEGGRISLVVLSPFEVQELLPLIRKHKRVVLHVYAPCLNMSARRLEDLSFCAIPPVPRSWPVPPVVRHLNIFAGQLYMGNYEEYIALCGFLGLSSKTLEGNMEVGSDGFVRPSSRDLSNAVVLRESPFMKSPVEFLRRILAMRRKEQSFAMSHFGMILNGELIPREKFEW